MPSLRDILEFVQHLDRHLNDLIGHFGLWSYLVLAAVIFAETGLVVTPFLPGDSLLFAVGALAAKGPLNVHLLFVLLTAAAIVGDTVNYQIGKYVGPKVWSRPNSRFLKREHLERTHRFFEKYGGKTIVLARFVPIVRTFAPFVAGVGAMSYPKFLFYNVVGAILWVGLILYAGFLVGNLRWVQDRFLFVEIAIVVVSLLPMLVELFRARLESRRATAAEHDGGGTKAEERP